MLEKELPTCPVFESLTALEIGKWHLTNNLYVVLCFLQLSPGLEKIKLMHKSGEGAGTNVRSTDGMTFQCPLLESVMIQCSEGDEGVDKLGNVLAANGVGLDKINVIVLVKDKYDNTGEVNLTYQEYIQKRALEDKNMCAGIEEEDKKLLRI